eukprot:g3643.t1
MADMAKVLPTHGNVPDGEGGRKIRKFVGIPAAILAVILLIAAIALTVMRAMVDSTLHESLTICESDKEDNNEQWQDFLDNKNPVHENRSGFDLFHMYSLQNPKEFMENGLNPNFVPNFIEVGPYAFLKEFQRTDITFSEEDGANMMKYSDHVTATYDQKKTDEMGCVSPRSSCSDTTFLTKASCEAGGKTWTEVKCDPTKDFVTSVNPTLIGAAGRAGSEASLLGAITPGFVRSLQGKLLQGQGGLCELIFKHKAELDKVVPELSALYRAMGWGTASETKAKAILTSNDPTLQAAGVSVGANGSSLLMPFHPSSPFNDATLESVNNNKLKSATQFCACKMLETGGALSDPTKIPLFFAAASAASTASTAALKDAECVIRALDTIQAATAASNTAAATRSTARLQTCGNSLSTVTRPALEAAGAAFATKQADAEVQAVLTSAVPILADLGKDATTQNICVADIKADIEAVIPESQFQLANAECAEFLKDPTKSDEMQKCLGKIVKLNLAVYHQEVNKANPIVPVEYIKKAACSRGGNHRTHAACAGACYTASTCTIDGKVVKYNDTKANCSGTWADRVLRTTETDKTQCLIAAAKAALSTPPKHQKSIVWDWNEDGDSTRYHGCQDGSNKDLAACVAAEKKFSSCAGITDKQGTTTNENVLSDALCLAVLGTEMQNHPKASDDGKTAGKVLAQIGALNMNLDSNHIGGLGTLMQKLAAVTASFSIVPGAVRTGNDCASSGPDCQNVDGLIVKKTLHDWYHGYGGSVLNSVLTGGNRNYAGYGAPKRTSSTAACSDGTDTAKGSCSAPNYFGCSVRPDATACATLKGTCSVPAPACNCSVSFTKEDCFKNKGRWNGHGAPKVYTQQRKTGCDDIENINYNYKQEDKSGNLVTNISEYANQGKAHGTADYSGKVQGYDGKRMPPMSSRDWESGKDGAESQTIWIDQAYQSLTLNKKSKDYQVRGIPTDMYKIDGATQLASNKENAAKFIGVQSNHITCAPTPGSTETATNCSANFNLLAASASCQDIKGECETCDTNNICTVDSNKTKSSDCTLTNEHWIPKCTVTKKDKDTAGVVDLSKLSGVHVLLGQPRFINAPDVAKNLKLDSKEWPTLSGTEKDNLEAWIALDKFTGASIAAGNQLQANFVLDGDAYQISGAPGIGVGTAPTGTFPGGTFPTQTAFPVYWTNEYGQVTEKQANDLKDLHDSVKLLSNVSYGLWGAFGVVLLVAIGAFLSGK